MSVSLRSSEKQAEAPAAVTAAGALCWRIRDGRLEVLLIHRPRYDDWSWPKGKLDAGETIPECAVREVREEVGLEVELGIPLPSIRYDVSAGPKDVFYWAAQADKGRPEPDGKETDEIRWVQPDEAHRLLDNPSDRKPLEALCEAHDTGRLQTYPVIVVRHAKAKPRSSWTRAENERPLAATGQRQALSVSRLLAVWNPRRVVSSPWRRCIQTIMPYIKSTNRKIRTADPLSEAGNARKPKDAMRTIEQLLRKGKSTVICTHRPVLPNVIKVLEKHMSAGVSAVLPASDPYLKPGALIVCHVSSERRPEIVSAEVYDAYDD
jgi:8-oxo-dGTP pyrophosphatase MutT (NUDIX family)/phosphohistidine phosphatase SixA